MGARYLSPRELPFEREATIAFGLARRGAPLGDVRGVEWPRLIARARQLGATIALQQGIAAAPGADVPDEARRAIDGLARQATFAQLYLRQRLEHSLEVLEREGVACIPLKGAAFLLADPAGTATRTMGDIDLLIRPEQASAARSALLASGWVTSRFESREAFYAEHHHLAPFDDGAGSGLSIEVHTEPLSPWHPFGLRAAGFWETADSHPARPLVYLPARREQLLHACLHFVWAHMGEFGGWRLARDVDALTADAGVDWPDFVRTARAYRAATTCYWALRFAREVAGVRIPDEVLAELAPRLPAAVLGGLAKHLCLRAVTGSEVEFPSVRLERALWRIMVQPVRSGHGHVRPWARDEGEFEREARHLRRPGPPTPRGTRMRRLVRHLWRSFGSAGAGSPADGSARAG